jgi:hypothetical protein
MKTCKWCNTEKSFDNFYKTKTAKDGLQSHCKDCHSKYNSKKYYENHEENRKRLSNYYHENHEVEKENRRSHYRNNKSTYLFNYYKREDRLKLATPSWLTNEMLQEIKLIYKRRQELSESTTIEYHVDHIIPIQGGNVCGLHVPWNLQILTAEENLRKSNKYE